ncbi:MAG TPA: tetratricopeptide repeat protein [Blastocatellia bacterium]|nr:tetratricopeptide repeat protein [Blastocatellia bacterium]
MKQTILTFVIAASVAFQQTQDASAIFNRAVQLQQQGKLTEAADEYRAALKLKPDYAEAHANLGAVLARLGKYDEAVAAYESALKLAPHLTPILLNLGIAHYRAGKFDQAVAVFQRFLEQRPDVTQARQLYGLSLAALGRDEEAVKQLEQTLDSAPPDAAALYSLGLAYLRLGKPGFRATLERLAAFPAGRPALHMLQGQAFLRDLEFEKALEELQSAARLNPDLPRLHFSLGLAHHQLGRHKEAVAAFEEEAKRNPQDFTTIYYLADALEKDGAVGAARQRVEAALALDSQSPEANGLLGKILFKQGKAVDAVKPLEYAAAKKTNDHELRYALARVYQQLGRREDAAREFAEVERLKSEQLKKDRARTPKP